VGEFIIWGSEAGDWVVSVLGPGSSRFTSFIIRIGRPRTVHETPLKMVDREGILYIPTREITPKTGMEERSSQGESYRPFQ
jgi:hypothetical protein